ncbi:MAG TPA: pyridoxal phosphate-dependent aminotransferase [Gemmatimonadota bacterium]|nr:pyridoxal phosphate-dependent aminotransferase [Gemmatimonadota bacterium]
MTVAANHGNLAGIEESATLGMTARAAALAREGRSVVSLSAGEPDFATPEYIREAGVRAIRDGHTHYPPAAGLRALREAIATHVADVDGAPCASAEVLVSAGAKQALFEAFFTLFGPGDRVLVPAPFWVSYPAMARLARAEPVIVETRAEDGWKLTPETLEDAGADGARGLVLNSPSNPTGAMYDAAELDALLEVAARHGIWIVSDEIYREIRYREPYASLAAWRGEYDRIVVVDGFSKAYAMTGWRVGYAVGPADVVEAMTTLQGHVNTNTALPCQYAALAALAEEAARRAAVGAMVEAFAARRALLLSAFEGVPGIHPLPPDGAFYLWVDARQWCAALGGDSEALCYDLLDHEGLALVPGSAFGVEGYVRLSFAAAEPVLEDAVGRLAAAGRRILGGER